MKIREEVQALDGLTFPGKTFADAVLEPVFNTQRDHYYQIFLQISLAHAVMLAEQGILSREEAAGILGGLDAVRGMDFSHAAYDPKYEDMFFMLEKDLALRIGADLAGRLHIARSRNDVGLCQYRMSLREKLLPLTDLAMRLMDVLLSLAAENTETVMPAYTHTQPAQPTTFAHYLLAFYDCLSRDVKRLFDAYHCINRSTIGAAAITTTGFPIRRERVSELLGFDGLVENSYDAIAGVNYITQLSSALTELGVDLSRFLKDTLDFCTREYGYYRLADPYVQISSIMPQKRNPSSLEHARPIASQLIAEAQAAVLMLHNTPFGDMVDSEEQLQPHLYQAMQNAARVLSLLTSNYATLTLNKDVMLRRAGEGFITATELADTLVREKGLPFRESHRITAAVVRAMHARGLCEKDLTPELLREIVGDGVSVDQELIARALDPVYFVRLRGVTGGVAPEETGRMISAREGELTAHRAEARALKARLDAAADMLERAVRAYLA